MGQNPGRESQTRLLRNPVREGGGGGVTLGRESAYRALTLWGGRLTLVLREESHFSFPRALKK